VLAQVDTVGGVGEDEGLVGDDEGLVGEDEGRVSRKEQLAGPLPHPDHVSIQERPET